MTAFASSTTRPAGTSAATRSSRSTGRLQRSRVRPRARASSTTASWKALHHLADASCGPVVRASAGTTPSTANRATWSRTIRS
jgi:hypothetical protein